MLAHRGTTHRGTDGEAWTMLLPFQHCSVPPTVLRSPNKDNPVSSKPRGSPSSLVLRQVRRSSSALAPFFPELSDHWFNSGDCWTVRMEGSRIVFPLLGKRSREIWIVFRNYRKTIGMQSEQGRPRIVLAVHPRPPCEECAKGHDSFMRTVRTSMSTQSFSSCSRFLHRTGHICMSAHVH